MICIFGLVPGHSASLPKDAATIIIIVIGSLLFQSSSSDFIYLVCSQWQPRWRDLCQAYFGPGCWIGKLSLAPSQAPPSSPGLQAQVWKASHVDLNAPSSACSEVRMRKEWRDRRDFLKKRITGACSFDWSIKKKKKK